MTSLLNQDIFDGRLLAGDKNRVVIKFDPNDIKVPQINVLQVASDGITLFIDIINDTLKIGVALMYLLVSLVKATPAVAVGSLIVYSGQAQLLLLPLGVFKEIMRLF